MQKNIYAFTALSFEPEYLSINDCDGKIEITVRSPKRDDPPQFGPPYTASMTIPRDQMPALIQSLLAIPPHESVAEAKPLVMYFATEADRQECIDAFKEIKPNARAVAV